MVRRELLRNRVPDRARGRHGRLRQPERDHRYLTDPAHREEGGTPAIIESIRAGLVFQLQAGRRHRRDPGPRGALPAPRRATPGAATSRSRSSATSRPSGCRSCRSWCAGPSGRYLHHNFVVAVLNDLFGIQSRGGCSCAGPYGHRLLGIDLDRSHEFERGDRRRLRGHQTGLGPGHLQLLHRRATVSYIVSAVDLVAKHGWLLLPEYRFDPVRGLWRHRGGVVEPPMRLAQVRYDAQGRLRHPSRHERVGENALAGYLTVAEELFTARAAALAAKPVGPESAGFDEHRRGVPTGVSQGFEDLRWFDLPDVCLLPG